jgi:hypothetical protein
MKRILFFILVASQAGATDCGNVLRDPGYDLWCGDDLCAWKIERGGILRVPTWNEGDPGVELVGDDVAIEQLAPVDSGDGTCIEFDLLANVDPDAQVDFNVDVLGDGSVEHTERLPTSNWKPLTYRIAIGSPYAGVRFEIAKRGSGRAQLASIGAKIVSGGCSNLDVIVASNRLLGAPCSDPAQCASGLCGTGEIGTPFSLPSRVCIACDAQHACNAGDVCGLDAASSPVRPPPTTCVPAAAKQLGEQCGIDDECATGFCTEHVCSTCRDSSNCTNGETCGKMITDTPVASVCSPLAHVRQHGEPCVWDDDCASSACVGPQRTQCIDGRACVTAAECPFGNADNVEPLQNQPCVPVGIQGGTCQ